MPILVPMCGRKTLLTDKLLFIALGAAALIMALATPFQWGKAPPILSVKPEKLTLQNGQVNFPVPSGPSKSTLVFYLSANGKDIASTIYFYDLLTTVNPYISKVKIRGDRSALLLRASRTIKDGANTFFALKPSGEILFTEVTLKSHSKLPAASKYKDTGLHLGRDAYKKLKKQLNRLRNKRLFGTAAAEAEILNGFTAPTPPAEIYLNETRNGEIQVTVDFKDNKYEAPLLVGYGYRSTKKTKSRSVVAQGVSGAPQIREWIEVETSNDSAPVQVDINSSSSSDENSPKSQSEATSEPSSPSEADSQQSSSEAGNISSSLSEESSQPSSSEATNESSPTSEEGSQQSLSEASNTPSSRSEESSQPSSSEAPHESSPTSEVGDQQSSSEAGSISSSRLEESSQPSSSEVSGESPSSSSEKSNQSSHPSEASNDHTSSSDENAETNSSETTNESSTPSEGSDQQSSSEASSLPSSPSEESNPSPYSSEATNDSTSSSEDSVQTSSSEATNEPSSSSDDGDQQSSPESSSFTSSTSEESSETSSPDDSSESSYSSEESSESSSSQEESSQTSSSEDDSSSSTSAEESSESSSSEYACEDPDGQDITRSTTVRILNKLDSSEVRSATDECSPIGEDKKEKVREHYCRSEQEIGNFEQECGEGSCCFAGACSPDFCSLCGNGTVEAEEECDDGNTKDGDGCSSTCKNTCEFDIAPDGELTVTEGSEREVSVFSVEQKEDGFFVKITSVDITSEPENTPARNVAGTNVTWTEKGRELDDAIVHMVSSDAKWYGDTSSKENLCAANRAGTGRYKTKVTVNFENGCSKTKDVILHVRYPQTDDQAGGNPYVNWANMRVLTKPFKQGILGRYLCQAWIEDCPSNDCLGMTNINVIVNDSGQYKTLATKEENFHKSQLTSNRDWDNSGGVARLYDFAEFRNKYSAQLQVISTELRWSATTACDDAIKALVPKVQAASQSYADAASAWLTSTDVNCWMEATAKRHISWTEQEAGFHFYCGYVYTGVCPADPPRKPKFFWDE